MSSRSRLAEDWEKLQAWLDKRDYASKVTIARFLANSGITTGASRMTTRLRRKGGVVVYSPARRMYTALPNFMEIIGDLMKRKRVAVSALINARGLIRYYERNKRQIRAACDKDNATYLAALVKFVKSAVKYLKGCEKRLGL